MAGLGVGGDDWPMSPIYPVAHRYFSKVTEQTHDVGRKVSDRKQRALFRWRAGVGRRQQFPLRLEPFEKYRV